MKQIAESPGADSSASQLPLLDNQCRNGCGYFGNPAWHGYCSKCYKDIHLKGEYSISNEAQRRSSLQSPSAASALQQFQGFEQKKRAINEKKVSTLKSFSLLRKSVGTSSGANEKIASLSDAATGSKSPVVAPTNPALAPVPVSTTVDIGQELSDFLRTIPDSSALDYSKQMRVCVDKMNEMAPRANVDQLIDTLQRFYRSIKDRIQTHTAYRDVSGLQRQKLVDYAERFVTSRLYTALFAVCGDEEADLRLQQRIRSLHFVTTSMLDARMDLQNLDVRSELDHAITALIEMDSRRPPTDKLAALLDACTYVQRAVRLTKQAAPSADDFLPALIYALLKANPPLLRSNMRYVERATMQERLNSGAPAYYYTNLCAAVTFLENVEARALGLSERQLEDYISRALPASDTLWLHGCAGQLAAERYSTQLADIHRRFDRLLETRLRVAADLNAFRQQTATAIQDCLRSAPINLPDPVEPAEPGGVTQGADAASTTINSDQTKPANDSSLTVAQ